MPAGSGPHWGSRWRGWGGGVSLEVGSVLVSGQLAPRSSAACFPRSPLFLLRVEILRAASQCFPFRKAELVCRVKRRSESATSPAAAGSAVGSPERPNRTAVWPAVHAAPAASSVRQVQPRGRNAAPGAAYCARAGPTAAAPGDAHTGESSRPRVPLVNRCPSVVWTVRWRSAREGGWQHRRSLRDRPGCRRDFRPCSLRGTSPPFRGHTRAPVNV